MARLKWVGPINSKFDVSVPPTAYKIDAVDADALAHFAQTYILSQPHAMAALGPLANLESQADFAARLTN